MPHNLEMETKNKNIFGRISFENENEIVRVADFTITGNIK